MYTRYHFRPQFVRFISLLICGAMLVSMFVATPRSSAKSPRKTKTTAPVVNPQGNSQRQRQPLPRDNSRRVDPIQPDRVGRPINLPSVDELQRRKPEKPEAPAPIPSTTRSPRKRVGKNKPVAAAISPENDRVVLSATQPMNRRAPGVVRSHHARLANVAMPQGPSNVALNKPATQSSTLDYNPPGDASHAVDGNTDGNYFHGSVTHTYGANQDWWQVDLGALYSLQTVNVWNRTDCCGDRLSNFYVFVSNNPFSSTDLATTLSQAGVSNYYTAGQGGTPTTISVNRTGRYLRVQLSGAGGLLSLAEVEAFGTLAPPPPTNVALNKLATQVSTLNYTPSGDASHAVDGNTDGNYFHASVTHTNGGNQEWWQVDLGASYSLQTINVWNRTDCCGDRLSNFYVLVSDNPLVSTNLTATLNQSGVSNYYTAGQGGTTTTLNINRTGRYVRVQLAGSGVILSLAEVEVFGTAAGSGGRISV